MILGVDPSTNCTGLAVIDDNGSYVDSRCHRRKDNIWDTVLWIEKFVVDRAVIEDQYIGCNPRSAIMVAKACGRWQGICDCTMIPHSTVMAATWQSRMLELGLRPKREERKLAARKFVEDKYSLTLSEDECDAVCIALYELEFN